eukprot:3435573-Rhodomonas_salina.1
MPSRRVRPSRLRPARSGSRVCASSLSSTQQLVANSATGLRDAYAMAGTDVGYAATRHAIDRFECDPGAGWKAV